MLVYEDEHLLVVNKPEGLLTIKDDKGGLNLYHELYNYVLSKHNKQRLFVVHRLDKDTSGLLIFAKDARTKTLLQECFEGRKVIGIDSVDMIWGLGSFHCLSQQEPDI